MLRSSLSSLGGSNYLLKHSTNLWSSLNSSSMIIFELNFQFPLAIPEFILEYALRFPENCFLTEVKTPRMALFSASTAPLGETLSSNCVYPFTMEIEWPCTAPSQRISCPACQAGSDPGVTWSATYASGKRAMMRVTMPIFQLL